MGSHVGQRGAIPAEAILDQLAPSQIYQLTADAWVSPAENPPAEPSSNIADPQDYEIDN